MNLARWGKLEITEKKLLYPPRPNGHTDAPEAHQTELG